MYTHNRSLPCMRLLCQSTLTRHAPAVVNELRTVGPCGGSEGKNYINTVQFLAQTDRFMSLDLNVSSRAAGFNLVLTVYVFLLSKPWVPLTDIIRLQRFELKIFICVLLKKQSHLHLHHLHHKHQIFIFG